MMFSGERRMSVGSKSESCTGRMSNSRSFSSSLSRRSSNSPSRFVFGAKRKILTKSPSAFSANEMRSGVLRKVDSGAQRARSHSRMRTPHRTAWGNDVDADSESMWDRHYRIRASRNRCVNDFDQHELDSFFEWVMERESSQPQQRTPIVNEEHDKRIAQIRRFLFK